MADIPILYEDEVILIANKLEPIPVQPEKTGDPSLQEILREIVLSRGGSLEIFEAVHRIDRRASGAVIYAKTPQALATMNEYFRERKIEKTYLAVVTEKPTPDEGTLEHCLFWNPRIGKAKAVKPGEEKSSGGKRAVLMYRVAGESEKYFLLEIKPLTGRHHQIRAQLSAIGCPIRGDLKYGAKRSTANGLIMLHASEIEFLHPVSGVKIHITAPCPDSEPLWQFLKVGA
jgi:23S rRNA pseudouridine1911/1915/1917 synthase